MMKNKVIVVLGTTASGKTQLAVELAKKFNGEIISADSRQVYRGMDIGTGKDLDEYDEIPYHMIDVADPMDDFSLADYQPRAYEAIDDVLKRKKTPIVCGGTGLYISALVDGYILGQCQISPEESKELRAELDALSQEELLTELERIDPETYEVTDRKNRRRVQRAVEIYRETGMPKSQRHSKQQPPHEFLQLGMTFSKEILRERIDVRLQQRLNEGMIDEVRQLHNQGVTWERLHDFGLEYRWVAEFLQKKITREELKKGLSRAIKQFAKRQMTWFKRDNRIIWIENNQQAEELAKDFLS